MSKSGRQFALASPTPNSTGDKAPVIYAHGLAALAVYARPLNGRRFQRRNKSADKHISIDRDRITANNAVSTVSSSQLMSTFISQPAGCGFCPCVTRSILSSFGAEVDLFDASRCNLVRWRYRVIRAHGREAGTEWLLAKPSLCVWSCVYGQIECPGNCINLQSTETFAVIGHHGDYVIPSAV